MRCAIVLIKLAGFGPCCVQQVSTAPGSTVVPSYLFTSRPGQIFQIQINQQQPTVCDCGNRAYAISKPGALCQTAIAGRLASSSDQVNRD
jgi:hypothetical protein